MNEEYVTYELAVKLKEKGFDEPCNKYYHIHNDIADCVGSLEYTGDCSYDFINSKNKYRCAAPTIAQVLKWLREEKNLFIDISLCAEGYYGMVYSTIFPKDEDFSDGWLIDGKYQTYEEAAIVGIDYVIGNLI